MKKMLEGKLASFKQAYELALMKYTQINRRSEALLVDVRAYDPGAMVQYPSVAQQLHAAKQELQKKERKYCIAEAQYMYIYEPEDEAVQKCAEERKAYEAAVKEFINVRSNTLKAWYALESATGEEEVEAAQQAYKEWESKLNDAPHMYDRTAEKYAEAWKKANQK